MPLNISTSCIYLYLFLLLLGQQKKTRFQKIREEKEQKQKEDELAAAKVYDSFVASFEVDDKASKTFVRGGQSDSSDKSNIYKLTSDVSTSKSNTSDMDDLMREIMVSLRKIFIPFSIYFDIFIHSMTLSTSIEQR